MYPSQYQSHHHHLYSLGAATEEPNSSSNLTSSPMRFPSFPHHPFPETEEFSFPRAHFENWGDSGIPASSLRTETSADDADDHPFTFGGGNHGAIVSLNSSEPSDDKMDDQTQKVCSSSAQTMRRLAQNREAARKSRVRKKAYIQQLESSRNKLLQLEQDLQRARQQDFFISSGCLSTYSHSTGGSGAGAFDMQYHQWLDEHQRHINDLRAALSSHADDNELRPFVNAAIVHYDEVFKLKFIGTKSDVFHILSGMWTTPAERCFMWLGGYRSSELLKILASQLEPLTDQQLIGLCNLQQSNQQAEDALSQGMEALQQSLAETLASASLGPSSTSSDNVASYMNNMALAMGKLGTLESFVRQADLLRQQTLQQMHRILTTRQSAHALLAINDYFSRLRALSSLWLARPRE